MGNPNGLLAFLFDRFFAVVFLGLSVATSLSATDCFTSTSAILFFAEFRPKKTMRIPLFVNIATESKQYIIDGQLVNERASPTFGTGIVFRLLELNLDRKSKIELEVGPLASVLADQNNKIRFSPVLASRFKLCRGENFVMYFGVNYSVGINAFGILYGTGTNF